MASLLGWMIPGWVILLVVVAVFELTVNRRRKQRRNPVSSTFTDEFTAMFYGTKRRELDHRESISMLRDEESQGGPPFGVDLAHGTVVLRQDPPDHSAQHIAQHIDGQRSTNGDAADREQ